MNPREAAFLGPEMHVQKTVYLNWLIIVLPHTFPPDAQLNTTLSIPFPAQSWHWAQSRACCVPSQGYVCFSVGQGDVSSRTDVATHIKL